MKIPQEIKRYCPHCREHHIHTVKLDKKGKTSPFGKKHRKRQRNIEKGYGGFPYENPANRSRGRKNPSSQKQDMKYKCKNCGKHHKARNPKRASRIEITKG